MGTINRTAQIRRPGRSVRSVSQAAPVPMIAESPVTASAKRTVFHNRVATKGRSSTTHTWLQPA